MSVSDRASKGEYKDEGIPALKTWLGQAIAAPVWRDETRLIAFMAFGSSVTGVVFLILLPIRSSAS